MDTSANKRILVIGHSHLVAIARAHGFYCRQPDPRPFDVEFLQLRNRVYQPNTGFEFDDNSMLEKLLRHLRLGKEQKSGRRIRKLNPLIERRFERLLRQHRPDLIASCAMGNEYNTIAMMNHPRRFDFYLPGWPHLPTDETAEVLPVSLVEDLLHARLGKTLALYLDMISLQRATTKIHIPPPPPIRDASHIRAYPGLFNERLNKFGISPPFFRLKMWLLTCEVQRKLCEARGVNFHQLPQTIFDADGFLGPRFWGKDPSHGNLAYGKAILNSIAATSVVARITESERERASIQKLARLPFLETRA